MNLKVVFPSPADPGAFRVATCILLFLAAIGSSWRDCSAEETSTSEAKAAAGTQENSAGQKTNRLAKESSPYLLLHAHNPVDWYPWGEEALATAKRHGKVIFLSIGYSSCHWCHVMERESFTDDEIAAFMNEHFISIKIDREERPDIDSIYMTSLQVFHELSGAKRGGGWPLSMFLTPDGKPFFGGTYFPARDGDRGRGTGLLTIIRRVRQLWEEKPDALQRDAETITRFTRMQLEGQQPDPSLPLNQELLDATLETLDDQYDEVYGGFGYDPRQPQRPKFPEPSNLFFLIDHVRKTNDRQAREMLVYTLERMSLGGIRDHLGGGFHRYSVDRFWQIPHFEKMLYDNGQLASVYAEAHALTGRADFRRVVEQTLEFVLREMTSEQGAFYSALDAESEAEEGKFYRWEKQEVAQLLDKGEYELFASVYGLGGKPNFEQRYYAPQLERPLHEIAADRELEAGELEARLAPIREKLFQARGKRPRPLTDTKVLTSWNGLMIRGFADAGRLLKDPRYTKAAERAAQFLLTRMRGDDGRLYRTFAGGEAKLNAYLNDYAFLVDGLIALYRATGDRQWLVAADQITAMQVAWFWDEAKGGFFFTSKDHEALLVRAKNPYDGAQPSGNSVSAENLIFLSGELNKPEYRVKAEQTLRSAGTLLRRSPAAATRMMLACSQFLNSVENRAEPVRDEP